MEDLGDDAEILSARRVRRGGVAGFFASEHVEVSARKVARSAKRAAEPMTIDLSDRAIDRSAQAMAFEEHLQQMVRAVEHEEAPIAPQPQSAMTAPVAPQAAPQIEPDVAQPMPRRLTDADLAPLPPAPAPAPILEQPAPRPVERAIERDFEPEERPARRGPRKPASHRRGPQWSVSNLRRLGVAEEVLRRLVAPQPPTDTAWTMALERAISDALPTGESRDRIAMHGYGAESAVTLLASALRGHRVDYIHLRERTAPASALELALAIRSCLCQ
jgi:hypothetical protein